MCEEAIYNKIKNVIFEVIIDYLQSYKLVGDAIQGYTLIKDLLKRNFSENNLSYVIGKYLLPSIKQDIKNRKFENILIYEDLVKIFRYHKLLGLDAVIKFYLFFFFLKSSLHHLDYHIDDYAFLNNEFYLLKSLPIIDEETLYFRTALLFLNFLFIFNLYKPSLPLSEMNLLRLEVQCFLEYADKIDSEIYLLWSQAFAILLCIKNLPSTLLVAKKKLSNLIRNKVSRNSERYFIKKLILIKKETKKVCKENLELKPIEEMPPFSRQLNTHFNNSKNNERNIPEEENFLTRFPMHPPLIKMPNLRLNQRFVYSEPLSFFKSTANHPLRCVEKSHFKSKKATSLLAHNMKLRQQEDLPSSNKIANHCLAYKNSKPVRPHLLIQIKEVRDSFKDNISRIKNIGAQRVKRPPDAMCTGQHFSNRIFNNFFAAPIALGSLSPTALLPASFNREVEKRRNKSHTTLEIIEQKEGRIKDVKVNKLQRLSYSCPHPYKRNYLLREDKKPTAYTKLSFDEKKPKENRSFCSFLQTKKFVASRYEEKTAYNNKLILRFQPCNLTVNIFYIASKSRESPKRGILILGLNCLQIYNNSRTSNAENESILIAKVKLYDHFSCHYYTQNKESFLIKNAPTVKTISSHCCLHSRIQLYTLLRTYKKSKRELLKEQLMPFNSKKQWGNGPINKGFSTTFVEHGVFKKATGSLSNILKAKDFNKLSEEDLISNSRKEKTYNILNFLILLTLQINLLFTFKKPTNNVQRRGDTIIFSEKCKEDRLNSIYPPFWLPMLQGCRNYLRESILTYIKISKERACIEADCVFFKPTCLVMILSIKLLSKKFSSTKLIINHRDLSIYFGMIVHADKFPDRTYYHMIFQKLFRKLRIFRINGWSSIGFAYECVNTKSRVFLSNYFVDNYNYLEDQKENKILDNPFLQPVCFPLLPHLYRISKYNSRFYIFKISTKDQRKKLYVEIYVPTSCALFSTYVFVPNMNKELPSFESKEILVFLERVLKGICIDSCANILFDSNNLSLKQILHQRFSWLTNKSMTAFLVCFFHVDNLINIVPHKRACLRPNKEEISFYFGIKEAHFSIKKRLPFEFLITKYDSNEINKSHLCLNLGRVGKWCKLWNAEVIHKLRNASEKNANNILFFSGILNSLSNNIVHKMHEDIDNENNMHHYRIFYRKMLSYGLVITIGYSTSHENLKVLLYNRRTTYHKVHFVSFEHLSILLPPILALKVNFERNIPILVESFTRNMLFPYYHF